MTATEIAKQAKEAQFKFVMSSAKERNSALTAIATAILKNKEQIKKVNQKDILEAKESKIAEALVDRLLLNDDRIDGMAQAAKEIAAQDEVVGEITESHTREDGLFIQRQRIPLGVIAMIFESRPNVVVDAACLAIKSGNAIILKGGKEAKHSNRFLTELVQKSIAAHIPKEVVQLVEDREDVNTLLGLQNEIDVVIPRGRASLIQYVYEHAKMPVIAHFAGLCHGYVHSDANQDKALEICLNAKAQRVSVCNAMETLLIHKDLPKTFTTQLIEAYKENAIELKVDAELKEQYPDLHLANEDDWRTEYLDKVLSIKTVNSLAEAIGHIQKYGTRHTEFICTEDRAVAQKFAQAIDASCILVNASSRFNDGGELGLGAELGISTSKFHAYGPMGAREMTTTRFLVFGDGHVRA